jgi:LacI family transcriptional regulator
MPRPKQTDSTSEPKLPSTQGTPAGNRITLQDIAQALGVSVNTVSLALRNSPRISAARREQIQQAARTMGYEPDPMLTALAHYRHTRIARPVQAALAWLNFWSEPKKLREHSLYNVVWKGAVAAGRVLGYSVEEFICRGKEPLTPQRLKTILVARGIRGILLPPQWPQVSQEEFEFDWSGFAAVRIGRSVLFPAVDVVTHSQAHDMLVAFRKIQEKGYSRIGFVTGPAATRSALFDAGFFKAQTLLPKKDRLPVLELEWSLQPTPKWIEQIDAWMRKHRPDAILSTDPKIKAIVEAAGYRVPKDVAIAATSVSVSDADAGNYENPEEVGRTAVNTLVGLLQRNELGIPEYTHDILVRSKWQDGTTLPSRR